MRSGHIASRQRHPSGGGYSSHRSYIIEINDKYFYYLFGESGSFGITVSECTQEGIEEYLETKLGGFSL
jgi:hypothetical protein